ncbi:MAG: RNA polymerase sporulation sigma factor SigK [Firmicutes bacterium]|nr:RNA polymerase sporulation sigma factor SigK [Bacillota bacterium]
MAGLLGLLAHFILALRELQLLVSYVKNNSFPQPLSEAEEAYYLDLWEQKQDDMARKKLIEHNLRLVAHIAKKYETAGEDPEDLISVGSIGLMKAVKTYNRDRGTKLATYAARCIDNEILMYLRATRRLRLETSLEEPIGVDKEGNEITLMDTLPADDDDVLQKVERILEQKKLAELLNVLTKRERLVLKLRYGLIDGVRATQREIAKELDISRSYVSRIEKRAIEKLISALEAEQQEWLEGHGVRPKES